MIKITFPKPEDAWAVQTVFYRSWLDIYPNKKAGITVDDIEAFYKDAFLKERLDKLRNRMIDSSKNGDFFIAREGNDVVGVCHIVKHADKNQLQAIYILPEHQRKGIGKMLWNKALEIVDPNKDIIVQVATYNKKAIDFYKKLGFVDTNKRFSDERFRMKSGSIIPEMELEIKAGYLKK